MSVVLPDWNNLKVLERNRLEPRTFFVPYAAEAENKGNLAPFSDSSVCVPLNGKWDFKYYSDSAHIPAAHADITGWDEVTVPHMWQFDGYEKPLYTNVRYPFPQTPPLVPSINPAGVYRRSFDIGAIKGDVIVSLLGVASAFHLYINGVCAGYGEVSHMTSEFDITSLVRKGTNEITVVVYKWCNGSYLEDQDMFRNNGIFRDVFLTVNPEAYIYDSVVKTVETDGGYRVELSAVVKGLTAGVKLKYRLERGGKVAGSAVVDAGKGAKADIFVAQPELWSAEIPNLYKLWVTLHNAEGAEIYSVCHSVGFCHVEIKGNVFFFNGKPIKLKGVNKHDTSPDKGYAVTREYELNELNNMKAHNVNCIRFSHYPPSPYVLEMCNQLGLYVVDEADIESHGGAYVEGWANYYADRPEWFESVFDRISRMFFRDRNNPCVVMWSLGNESGFGQNHIKCAEWLYTVTDIPVHYERARDWKDGGFGFSVVSHMYTNAAQINEYGEKQTFDKPFYLCEYAHAMGVGPGGLKEYWEAIHAHDCLMGGCIWEWRDHAILHADGPYKYTYGGDHGEYVHDGNFCVDGMIFPDGTSSPSALEVKNVYRPVISKFEDGKVILKNMQYFASADFLMTAELICDGKAVGSESVDLNIAPQSEWIYDCKLIAKAVGRKEYLLNLTYYKDSGDECGKEQHAVTAYVPYVWSEAYNGAVKADESAHELRVSVKDTVYVFDKSHANLKDIIIGGISTFNPAPVNSGYNYYSGATMGFAPEIMRYCIDNDRNYKRKWEDNYFNLMWVSVIEFGFAATDNKFELKARLSYSPPVVEGRFEAEIVYTVNAEGELKVKSTLLPLKKELPWLAKFGLKTELMRSFDTLEWYGYGEGENYPDFLECARLGEYRLAVDKLCPPYIRPQEGGNRGGVRRAALINNAGGVCINIVACDKPLNVSARHFDAKSYVGFRHIEDIADDNTTQVYIDGFFSGIGSNSCGPFPEGKYLVHPDKSLSFEFVLIPSKI